MTALAERPAAAQESGCRRMHEFFERSADRAPEAVAVEIDGRPTSYRELDERANALAHLLRSRGVRAGSRVAIFLPRCLETYVCLLGIGKAGAAFVPIDPESPAERVAYIADDARVDLVLTSTALAGAIREPGREVLEINAPEALAGQPRTRPKPGLDESPDPAAYVIYTSGSSGRPKGVEVGQSSIANFLSVVPDVYDVRPTDRVHQGMTISFDFSIEEIWPTWARGATLVAAPEGASHFGADLADHLDDSGVTVLYCVPTLLATLPHDVAGLRSILVGGEACPGELVSRWARPGRRMLNTYGPTEATVTATWCELLPDRPVTIGKPLPTYRIELIEPEADAVVPVADGEVGEIAIGGPGVARGYVGRPELTERKFLDEPDGGRLYRTGDLGRRDPDGDVEYLGRADDEVKVRGRRVDLGEIESVLLEDPAVTSAVVAQVDGDLAAWVTLTEPGPNEQRLDELIPRWHAVLTERLPAYMVPSTVDVLDALPTQLSGKVDRKALPAPAGRRLAVATGPVVEAASALERRVAAVWAEAVGVAPDALSVEADFFDDLGGHSLLAASVVSALRAVDLGAGTVVPAVRDLYEHPTVRALAAELARRASTTAPVTPRGAPLRHSSRKVAGAGVAQSGALYLLALLLALPTAAVYVATDGQITLGTLAPLLVAAFGTWLGMRWVLPLAFVPLLTAGVRPGRYPLWGATFLRLWAADLLLSLSPLPVLAGSPLVVPYLRALGARIGRHAHIASGDVALPALLEIGDGAAIGYGATLRAWHVEDGRVVVGRITVGPDAVVGTNAVLAPDTALGAHALLAEQSALAAGAAVGEGQAFAGSPAVALEEIDDELAAVMSSERAPGWTLGPLLGAAAGLVGLEATTIAMVLPSVALVWAAVLGAGVLVGLVVTVAAGPVFVLTACALVAAGRKLVLPRVPVGVHPVRSGLGVRKWIGDKLLEASLTYTNALYATLWTAPWLRILGARIGRGAEVSTVAHVDPDLLDIGHDSFVADMAAVGSATFANGRIVVRPTRIADRSFVGNAALLPAGVDTGTGSLVGVLTVPPRTGVPEQTSWLGSPAIDLPRRETSESFDEFSLVRPTVRQAAHRLAIEFVRATLPASVVGLALYVYLWLLSIVVGVAPTLVTLLVAPLLAMATSAVSLLYLVWTKRNVVGTYRPRVEPLWSGFVRRSEFVTGLYEAAAVPSVLALLVGTPMLPRMLRLFGATIGRRCFVASTYLTEFDLVHLGDDVAVNHGVSLQTHLFEDRVMKMSTVRVGDGATIGTRSIVLYDATVGDGVLLDPLTLVMKGEQLPERTRWRGVPAESA